MASHTAIYSPRNGRIESAASAQAHTPPRLRIGPRKMNSTYASRKIRIPRCGTPALRERMANVGVATGVSVGIVVDVDSTLSVELSLVTAKGGDGGCSAHQRPDGENCHVPRRTRTRRLAERAQRQLAQVIVRQPWRDGAECLRQNVEWHPESTGKCPCQVDDVDQRRRRIGTGGEPQRETDRAERD